MFLMLGYFHEERVEGFIFQWTTHLTVPLCKYLTTLVIPLVMLYLPGQGHEFHKVSSSSEYDFIVVALSTSDTETLRLV